MTDFFQQYFIDPIVTQGVAGYNVFNTPVYAVCFALAVFGAYKLLRRLNVEIDRYFLAGILPFILSGSVWRVVRDSQLSESPILVTPLIYFAIFVVAVVGLLVAVGIERVTTKKIKTKKVGSVVPKSYYKIWFVIGFAVLLSGLIVLARLPVQNFDALGVIAGLAIVWAVAASCMHNLSGKIKAFAVFTRENCGLLWAHLFDATTTFTALQFFATSGYYEQHVVSTAVIDVFGPAGQFLLKLVVLIPVLWLIDRELSKKEDMQLRGFIKIAILILGLAPGVRNGLRLVLGV